MQDLEQFLSPIIANHTNISDKKITDLSLMEQIKEQKLNVQVKRSMPSVVSVVRPEIIDSWMRSFENGLDPYNYNYPTILDKASFERRLAEKAFFLETAEPYMCQFEKMLDDMECYLFLSDDQGTILRTSNTLGKNKFWLSPGTVWTEETTGTCSHGLSIKLKTPIQICGPEHFSQIFKNITCSSAPVFDTCGNLEGVLSISSHYLHSQSSHSLGLVVSIASAIQKEFQLSERKALLNVALSSKNDAVIVMNQCGLIFTANSLARSFFEQNLDGSRIENILGEQPLIKSVIETGIPILNTDVIIKEGKQRLQIRTIQPVKNFKNVTTGCVLTLSQIGQTEITTKTTVSTVCPTTRFMFSKIVGSSHDTIRSISLAKKFARIDSNVLIQGESGTGKEVYAQAIHNEYRPEGPFIAVNCAAIPINLAESELFGYEAGAFTGAERRGKPGKIELANGGTLFLDEIGDMPLELQAVLLRVLEDKLIMRVGGTRYTHVDFKLIAATNRDLMSLVKKKKFREDLYYRLSAFKIDISPLRERNSDIIDLAEHFINVAADAQRIERPALSNSAKYLLVQYQWPGNVRQLQNAMSYGVCMSEGKSIQPEHLPREINDAIDFNSNEDNDKIEQLTDDASDNSDLSMKDLERFAIKKALDDTNNMRDAAKKLGISKSTIYRKIKEFDISGTA